MKSKDRKVIFINAENQKITIKQTFILADLQKLVGGLIERAHILQNNDELYVNEEGLFASENYFFTIKGGHQPFAGNGYIIGPLTKTGDNTSVQSTIEEIEKQITFMGKKTINY
jgi:hypothetical protein